MSGFQFPWRSRRMIEGEIEEEFRLHLELRTEELVANGASPESALRQAQEEFGDIDAARRYCRGEDQRHERRRRWRDTSEDVVRDLGYAIRSLWRSPGYTVTSGITLALGLGITVAVFSVVHGILLRPLPYPDQDRIVTLSQVDTRRGSREFVSAANLRDWHDRSTLFSAMAVAEPFSVDLFGDGPPVSLQAWLVSEEWMETLGLRPVLGPGLRPEYFLPGAEPVVMVSYATWLRQFGGDSLIVGRSLTLDGEPVLVAGVLPPTLRYPSVSDLWLPRAFQPGDASARPRNYLRGIAKLRDGVSIEQANGELARISTVLQEEYPRINAGIVAEGKPIVDELLGDVRTDLWVLFGAVILLLLVAVTNVVHLAIARATKQGRDIALRAALGAGRARLIRQASVENLLLVVGSTVAGFGIAHLAIRAMVLWAPADLPRVTEISFDPTVVAAGILAAILTAMTCGLVPAVFSLRSSGSSLLRATPSGGGRRDARFRHGLVALEVAMAVMLLVGAGLLGRSFVALLQQDLGYETEGRLGFTIHVWDKYPDVAQRVQFFRDAVDRLATVPGVESVGAGSALPLSKEGSEIRRPVQVDDELPGDQPAPEVVLTYVTPEYFGVLGIPLQDGRMFQRGENTAVAIVSQEAARQFWPGRSPLGRRISLIGDVTAFTVIGVVGDVRYAGYDDRIAPGLYLSNDQVGFGSMTFTVNSALPTNAILPALQEAMTELNPLIALGGIEEFRSLLGDTVAGRRYVLGLLGGFSVMASLLALLGIYGILNYSVALRTREIGVRMALGAHRRVVTRLVLRQGMGMVLSGLIAGLLGAFAMQRVLASLLFGVSATDPVTYVGLSGLVIVSALVAAWVPATRAAAIDPAITLREE